MCKYGTLEGVYRVSYSLHFFYSLTNGLRRDIEYELLLGRVTGTLPPYVIQSANSHPQ